MNLNVGSMNAQHIVNAGVINNGGGTVNVSGSVVGSTHTQRPQRYRLDATAAPSGWHIVDTHTGDIYAVLADTAATNARRLVAALNAHHRRGH